MGRKGIGRRKKSGTEGSSHLGMKRQLVRPDEVRADHYEYGAANRRVTITRRRESSNFLKSDSDNSDDDVSDNPPQGLQLKAVVVGDERFLFGKGTSIGVVPALGGPIQYWTGTFCKYFSPVSQR